VTSAVVFLGPTLPVDEARAVLDAQYLPPAGRGDVLQAALRRPRVIAVVDGVFEREPSVWHKEILFALSEGIHVYGAASMGALRAAELDAFGMLGIGDVYRAYADGTLEDDDEVAVAHADADHAFRALSDAMVDVRATLDAAVASGVVTEETAAEISARVKATFYAQRLLVSALDRGDAEHERLRAWLPEGRVWCKRDDALAMLRAIAIDLEADLEPARPTWTLQRTRAWDDMRRSVELAAKGQSGPTPARVADEELEAVLDEARLDPDLYHELLDRSLLSALAGDAAAAVGVDVSPWAHQAALDHERLQRGLLQPEDVDDWLQSQDLTDADLPAVARRLAVLRWAHQAHRGSVSGEVALTLRADDAYAGLANRAARKRDALARLPSGGDVDDSEAVAWYFRERLGQEVPPALDAWASAHGWHRASELVRALRAEWLFERTLDPVSSHSARPAP
jgi:hypothetical protein